MPIEVRVLPPATKDLADAACEVAGRWGAPRCPRCRTAHGAPGCLQAMRGYVRRLVDNPRRLPEPKLDPNWRLVAEALRPHGERGVGAFWAMILDAREAEARAERERALSALYGRDGWSTALYEERCRRTSDDEVERWSRELDEIGDAGERLRLLKTPLATYEDAATGARVNLTVRDVIDGTFRRGRGAKRTASGETAEWVLMVGLRQMGLTTQAAAEIASDLLCWFVTGERSEVEAIRRAWYKGRSKVLSDSTRPSSRWDPPPHDSV